MSKKMTESIGNFRCSSISRGCWCVTRNVEVHSGFHRWEIGCWSQSFVWFVSLVGPWDWDWPRDFILICEVKFTSHFFLSFVRVIEEQKNLETSVDWSHRWTTEKKINDWRKKRERETIDSHSLSLVRWEKGNSSSTLKRILIFDSLRTRTKEKRLLSVSSITLCILTGWSSRRRVRERARELRKDQSK